MRRTSRDRRAVWDRVGAMGVLELRGTGLLVVRSVVVGRWILERDARTIRIERTKKAACAAGEAIWQSERRAAG